MVEGGRGLGFPAEALQSLRVLRNVLWQELQGDVAVELGILSFVDDTHTSAADLLHNFIMRNRLPDHGIIIIE
jgi:hypothetical protein